MSGLPRIAAAPWWPALVAAGLLAALTEVPYAHGQAAAGPGRHYDGIVAHSDDIHAYLSFARQARDGRTWFENRYAPAAHRPAFFNLEWLLVGKAWRFVGDPRVLGLWRVAGVFVLVLGFWALSAQSLDSLRARGLALALFGVGGGFGWVVALAGGIDPARTSSLPMDLGEFGLHPFVQMLQNPHFALPHGLVLWSLAFLAAAERTGRRAAYAAAGAVALAAGLSRPYELAAFGVVVPLLHLASGKLADARGLARRGLVLLMLAPAFWPVVVIWREPEFRSLTGQGLMPPVDPLAYAIGIGVCLLLVALRLVREPGILICDPVDRLLLVWGAVVLVLVQANRVVDALSFSPQLMVTTMAPLVLLAAPVVARAGAPAWPLALVLSLVLPSSALVLHARMRDAESGFFRYSDGERQAWEWLEARVAPGDLILATAESGNRLPRHVPARVFVGHWTLTPDYAARRAEAEAFFGGLDAEAARSMLETWGVDWIWIGPRERSLGGLGRRGVPPGCVEPYRLLGVRILRCGAEAARDP